MGEGERVSLVSPENVKFYSAHKCKGPPYKNPAHTPAHVQHVLLWIQERSPKQVNLMATPTDKSLKVITATIQDVLQWQQFEDKMAVIYEVFGKNPKDIHHIKSLKIKLLRY